MGTLSAAFTTLIGKASGWIDQIFSIFGLYTSKYSKLIVYAVLLLIASKIFKFKFNLGGNRK